MKYKRGQQLVCIFKGTWRGVYDKRTSPGPVFNEIVTCDGYSPFEPGFIFLKEYYEDHTGRPTAFFEECFEPLVSDKVLAKELNSIFHKAKA